MVDCCASNAVALINGNALGCIFWGWLTVGNYRSLRTVSRSEIDQTIPAIIVRWVNSVVARQIAASINNCLRDGRRRKQIRVRDAFSVRRWSLFSYATFLISPQCPLVVEAKNSCCCCNRRSNSAGCYGNRGHLASFVRHNSTTIITCLRCSNTVAVVNRSLILRIHVYRASNLLKVYSIAVQVGSNPRPLSHYIIEPPNCKTMD